MPKTLLLFVLTLVLSSQQATSQTAANAASLITWTTSCADKTYCLNQNQCANGNVLLTTSAWTTCPTPGLNFSYKIDLGNNGSIDMQGVNDSISATFVKGTHKITWRATDGCFTTSSCSYIFTIEDCQAPYLLCNNGLSQGIDPPACLESFSAEQFILNLYDNCTPTEDIEIGMRLTGSGSGFPESNIVNFDECDIGINFLQIVVRDAAGLMNICNTYVLVQPNTTGCYCNPDADLFPNGCVRKPDGQKLTNYVVHSRVESLSGVPLPISRQSSQYFVSDSCYRDTVSQLPFGGTYRTVVHATRPIGDFLDGVSTVDLVVISRHVLGLQPLPSFYHVYAADVNKSQTVTTLDIVDIRKLILGITDTLPVGQPWRVIRPVPNPQQLASFAAVKDTYQIILPNLLVDLPLDDIEWVGVKMGDVNNSVQLVEADDRSPLAVRFDDRWLAAGEIALVPLRWGDTPLLAGWQLALASADALEIVGVEGLPDENYALNGAHALRALWHAPDGRAVANAAETPLLSLRVRARTAMRLSDALSFAETTLPALAVEENARARMMQLLPALQAASDVVLLAPQPNPMQAETRFGLISRQETMVRLEIFDLSGRLVYAREEAAPVGRHDLMLQRTALPGDGVYIYRVSAGGSVRSGRLVL